MEEQKKEIEEKENELRVKEEEFKQIGRKKEIEEKEKELKKKEEKLKQRQEKSKTPQWRPNGRLPSSNLWPGSWTIWPTAFFQKCKMNNL